MRANPLILDCPQRCDRLFLCRCGQWELISGSRGPTFSRFNAEAPPAALTAAPTAVSDEALGVSYQWQRSGDGRSTWTRIAGASGATYTLHEGDENNLVRVEASVTDDTGQLVTTAMPPSK